MAVGGSAYAVSKIDSGDIRNRSIQGKDVASETLGGKQINEAKLTGGLGADVETTGTCDPSLVFRWIASDALSAFSGGQRSADCVRREAKTDEAGGIGVCEIAVDGSTANGQIAVVATP